MFVSVVQCEGKIVVERKIENRKIGAEEKKNRKEQKIDVSHTGNRTRATAVRAPDPNH